MKNWKEIAQGFAINQKYIWLNSAGMSTPHDSMLEHMKSATREYSEHGYLAQEYSYHNLQSEIKAILAKLLNSRQDEVALIHNTAEGMNFAAHGIDLRADDEILLLEKEYPSNVYPWFSLRDKGVRVKFMPTPTSTLIDETAFLHALEDNISPRTKLISLSAVHWLTGTALPLKKIGELCRTKDIIFVVDAAQALGHIKFHPKDCHISFLCGSAWKWLLGPVGLGYLYIAEDFLERVHPVFWGTDSVIDSDNYLPYKEELKSGADRFSYSSASFLDWVYFRAGLGFLNSIGFERVYERIHSLADSLRKNLSESGFRVFPPLDSTNRTGIVAAEHDGIEMEKLHARLEERGVITALRDGRIRFSTHLMNTEDQFIALSRHIDIE